MIWRLGAGVQAVADPRFCEDVARFRLIRFDLLSKMADEDPQVFGLFYIIFTPDDTEQNSMGMHFARVADEIDQEFVFLGRQTNHLPAHAHAAGFEVDAKIARLDDLRATGNA